MNKNDLSDKELRQQVYKKYDGHCAYCGIDLYGKFTIDHIEARHRDKTPSERGKNSVENYNPCCMSCNASKQDMTIEEWRAYLINKIIRLSEESSNFRILNRFGIIEITDKPIKFHFEK